MLAVILTFVGCAEHYRVDNIISSDEAQTDIRVRKTGLFADDESITINPYAFTGSDGPKSLYSQALELKESGRLARNRLQAAILGVSDRVTSAHLSAIKSTDNFFNLIFGAATSALSGGAAVAAETTARGLSAAATGTNAARSLVNEQVYRNALTESLTRAIGEDRRKFRLTVIDQKTKLPVTDYSVDDAIRDAVDYHERGSFYNGLSLIREAVEAETRAIKAVNEKNELRAAEVTISQTHELLRAIRDLPDEQEQAAVRQIAGKLSIVVPNRAEADLRAIADRVNEYYTSADSKEIVDSRLKYINSIILDALNKAKTTGTE